MALENTCTAVRCVFGTREMLSIVLHFDTGGVLHRVCRWFRDEWLVLVRKACVYACLSATPCARSAHVVVEHRAKLVRTGTTWPSTVPLKVGARNRATVLHHMRRHSRIAFPFDPFVGAADERCYVHIMPKVCTPPGDNRRVTVVVTSSCAMTKVECALSLEDESVLRDLNDCLDFGDRIASTDDCYGCVKHDVVQVDDRHGRPMLRGHYCREHGTVTVTCAAARHDYVMAHGHIIRQRYAVQTHDRVYVVDARNPHFIACAHTHAHPPAIPPHCFPQ